MRINKYIGPLALALGIAMPIHVASASETTTNENYIIETSIENIKDFENFEKASAAELKAYDEYEKREVFDIFGNKASKLSELKAKFGNEYELRYELAKSIKTLEKLEPLANEDLINKSLDILNASDLDQISRQDLILKTHIIEKNDKLRTENKLVDTSLSPNEEIDLADQTLAYINEGMLFASETIDKNENLENFKNSILNSVAYYKASDEEKEAYDKLITELDSNQIQADKAYDILDEFVNTENKLEFDLANESTDIFNTSFNASNEAGLSNPDEEAVETTTIENPSQNAEAESSGTGSGFLTNPNTSSAYNELTDPQKRELDAIDTDNNGILSNAELDNSANYTSNIESDSWLYPFTEAGSTDDGSETTQTVDEATQPVADNTNNDTNTITEPTNSGGQSPDRQTPQTVTIDDNTKSPELNEEEDPEPIPDEDEVDVMEDDYDDDTWSEAVASENTNTEAASIVKTGIKGLGIVALVLVLAVAAYYVVSKDKNPKDNTLK